MNRAREVRVVGRMSPSRFVVVLVVLVFATGNTGCAATRHANVARAPTRDAAPAQREEFYARHRPLGLGGLAAASPWTPSQTFLTLADGTLVKEPRDLVANVAPDSLTAQAAARAEARAEEAEVWSRVGGVVMSIGVATMLASLVPPVVFPPPEDPAQRVSLATLGPPFAILGVGSAIALSSIVPFLVAQDAAVVAEQEKQAAFISYDASLRAHLGLAPFAVPQALAANRGAERAPPDPLD
jgi:hypothetical protein